MKNLIANTTQPFRNLREFQSNPYRFFSEMMPINLREPRHLKLGLKNFYFFYHPDHAKHILLDNKDNYPKSSLVLKKILPLSGPTGLIQLKDKEAKSVRQVAGQLMHPKRAQQLSHYVEGFVREEFQNFDKAADKGEAVDLKPFLTQIVLRTAGMFILNEDIQTKTDKLNNSFVELNRMAGESLRSVFTSPISFKRQRHLKIVHQELDLIIKRQLDTDAVSLLHELKKMNFSKSFIRDQIKAFMFAGYDTTASSLIFAVDSIARSQSVQDGIMGESHLNYKVSSYTQAAYKESLRLYPSAYFLPRQTLADDDIGGVKIKAGSQVFISIKHVQRSPDIFSNPNDFQPERFLQDLSHPFAFIPFGGGGRICIGAPLALMEATVVLKELCQRYRIFPVNHQPPEIEGLITAHTKSPLNVKLERRVMC